MDCREFRETYTDLLDGLLEEADEIRFHVHMAECPPCHRFDQAYRIGVSALRGLPRPRTSRTFTARVLHTTRTDPGRRAPSLTAGFAGAALVAALLGFFAVDLGVLERRDPVAVVAFPAATFAEASADSAGDLITFRLRDPADEPVFWNPNVTVQVRNAGFSPHVRFAVPAVWAGR
jgi:anti-sigma factor RsiW